MLSQHNFIIEQTSSEASNYQPCTITKCIYMANIPMQYVRTTNLDLYIVNVEVVGWSQCVKKLQWIVVM
jgi:hypothetical protein